MARDRFSVRVEGLRELQREVSRLGDTELKRALRGANRRAAEVVRDAAAPRVPVRSGRLARTLGVVAGLRDAAVKAGASARAPHAGPIHWGWPARHIAAQPFLLEALRRRIGDVRRTYEGALDDLADQFNRR